MLRNIYREKSKVVCCGNISFKSIGEDGDKNLILIFDKSFHWFFLAPH